jgi:hypothetical protein
MRICLSSKPFEATAFVALLSTHGNHMTSTTFAQLRRLNRENRIIRFEPRAATRPKAGRVRSSKLTAGSWFSARDKGQLPHGIRLISARAEAEAFKLEKRSLEGFCE